MNRTISFGLIMILLLSLESCFDATKPNYQYFPNMYEPVGYEAYADSDAFANGIEAQLPVEGTINRGWIPYDYQDSNEGYELAKADLKSPIEVNNDNLKLGKELYGIYCAVCHGFVVKSAGGIPDLRKMSAGVHDAFNQIVLEGLLASNGMASFSDVLTEQEVENIHHYVKARAHEDREVALGNMEAPQYTWFGVEED